MIIHELLRQNNMSQYKLSKASGVSQSTISDICNGKVAIEKCSMETMYSIAKALNTTLDAIMKATEKDRGTTELRDSFDVFKNNVCHYVKSVSELDFIAITLTRDEIHLLYQKKWYAEAFYLLGMVDYLSRLNGIPLCTLYNDMRRKKLAEPLYPTGILLQAALTGNASVIQEAYENAIPEFKRFNIIENEVQNIA